MTATIFYFLAKRDEVSDGRSPPPPLPNDRTLGRLVEGLNALIHELEYFYVEMERVISQGAISVEDQSTLRLSQISVVADIQKTNETLCSLLQEIVPANALRTTNLAELSLPSSTPIVSQILSS